jgi:hypothetical protein
VQTKRKEQRLALGQSDAQLVFKLEAEISGVEEVLKIYDSQASDKKDVPTIHY